MDIAAHPLTVTVFTDNQPRKKRNFAVPQSKGESWLRFYTVRRGECVRRGSGHPCNRRLAILLYRTLEEGKVESSQAPHGDHARRVGNVPRGFAA